MLDLDRFLMFTTLILWYVNRGLLQSNRVALMLFSYSKRDQLSKSLLIVLVYLEIFMNSETYTNLPFYGFNYVDE